MIRFFREVQVLQEEGKIHSKLITRVRIMFGVSFILLCVSVYNLYRNISLVPLSVALAAAGFVLGFYVFSRISAVVWDEKAEMLSAARMDIVGYGAIALYIVFEIGLRIFLGDFFATTSEALLFVGIFGTIFGRAVGMVIEIHRAYRASHH